MNTAEGSRWRKSSRSNAAGECVEVAELGDSIAVRDSKDPGGPVLKFGNVHWRAFIVDVKSRSWR